MLGLAMNYPAAVALTSAWKAHLEFEGSQFDAMVRSIRVGMQYAEPDDHDSQVRLAMVLANAFLVSGDRANSQVWFTKARGHAVKNGDQASIEALLYNRTVFGIASIRSDKCVENAVLADLAITRKEVESATNLQELTKITALTNHIHLWSARLSILERNFLKAIDELASSRSGLPFADYNFSQEMIALEMVYCLGQAGRLDEATVLFDTVDLETIDGLDLDEQLVAASMLYELEAISSRFRRKSDTQIRLEQLKSKYLSDRSLLRGNLNEWAP
jgi:hypothetical protein